MSWLPNEKTEGPHEIKNTVNSMLLMRLEGIYA